MSQCNWVIIIDEDAVHGRKDSFRPCGKPAVTFGIRQGEAVNRCVKHSAEMMGGVEWSDYKTEQERDLDLLRRQL